jgi:hypothetical protein
MQNTYDEIRADLQHVADYFEDREITYKAFNGGIQFNAMDDRGVWHSFYPTTGTVIIHRSNDRKDHEIRTFYNKSLEAFANAMFKGEALQKYFK